MNIRKRVLSMSEKKKVLILAFLVGLSSGVAAVILTSVVKFLKSVVDKVGEDSSFNWPYLLFPAVGMLLSLLLLKFIIKDDIGHGVTKVLHAISKNDSRIKPHNMWSSLLTSALTIGFGGSAGTEAPIVYTGAAIGSNFARWSGLTYRNMTILLGCGAAGAIAGIFKAPLAGVLFTMEVLLFNISMTSMFPLLLSTISATMVTYLLCGDSSFFSSSIVPFSMANIPFYVILGLFCGLCSVYFIRATLSLEDKFQAINNIGLKWVICALGLGVLIFLFPQLYGEGYNSLGVLLNGGNPAESVRTPLHFLMESGWGVPFFFLLVMLLKVVSMTLTNSGGGVGGTFGPTLFVGALAGFFIARSLNLILANSGISVPEQNFVLVGMAGLMAGAMQAPMTSIFLIAEMTGGYELLVPLILTTTVSFGFTRIFERYSIYTKRLAQMGELLTHDNDRSVLTLLKTSDLIKDKYPRLDLNASLREIAGVVSQSTAAVFPVLDKEGRLQGVLEMDDIRKVIFKTDDYDDIFVYNLMQQPPTYVYEGEKMDSVMRKFDRTGAWRLPVVKQDREYLGFISKSRILTAYREELQIISQD